MPSPPSAALTRRQREILQMIASGRSTAQIGRALYLSPNGVRTHMRRIYSRLGALDRAHAVALGCRVGAVDLDRLDTGPPVDRGPHASRPDLRAARRAAGLTQLQAGALLGVSQAQVSDWETGARRISAADAHRFIEAVKPRE